MLHTIEAVLSLFSFGMYKKMHKKSNINKADNDKLWSTFDSSIVSMFVISCCPNDRFIDTVKLVYNEKSWDLKKFSL